MRSEEEKRYDVFHRTWWKEASRPGYPNNLEPAPGEKHYLAKNVSWSGARALCDDWNAENEPGRYSDKAEFEEA